MREPSPGHWRTSDKRPQVIGPLNTSSRPTGGRIDPGTVNAKTGRKGAGSGTIRVNARRVAGAHWRKPRH